MNEENARQNDDRQLLAAVVTGRPDAFAALYDRLNGPLYAMCLRMTGDATEAEDILQEAFLVIWRRAVELRRHAEQRFQLGGASDPLQGH